MPKESEPIQMRAPSSEQGVPAEEVLLLSALEEPVGAGAADEGAATEVLAEVAKVVWVWRPFCPP
jgi:hypothetical protein